MIQYPIYTVTTKSNKGINDCIEVVWTRNIHYAYLYAKFSLFDDSGIRNTVTIKQYNEPDDDILEGLTENNMLKIVTNNMGEQFLITDVAENNMLNLGMWKMISNKYLNMYEAWFNKNGAGALFATLHTFTKFDSMIKNESVPKQAICKLFSWMTSNVDKGAEMDYFTYYTITSKHAKRFRIGLTKDAEKKLRGDILNVIRN